MNGVVSLPSAAVFPVGGGRREIGGGARHVAVCDRGEVVNVVLWDGAAPYRHPKVTRADGSASEVALLRHETLAIGDHVANATS